MSVTIVSTLSKKYWKQTGQYTLPTWKSNIPNSWKLCLHDSPAIPIDIDQYIVSSIEKTKWFEDACQYTKDLKQPLPPGFMKEWKKFYHKSFAQWETCNNINSKFLVWCDADVKYKKPLTEELLKECLNGKFCGYFGRDRVNTQDSLFIKDYGQYKTLTPETCFIVYDLTHPISNDFFNSFKEIYLSMELFNNMSWCDAGAFITAVNKFPNYYFNDITKDIVPTPCPLNVSLLDEYIEHWIGTINKKNKKDIKGVLLKERIFKNE